MELTVLERLLLLNLLPPEGDLTTLRVVHNLRQDLSFSEAEHELLKFVQTDGRITWDTTQDHLKEVGIGLRATNIIVGRLTELSTQKKLTEQHLTLCDKFVGMEETT